MSHSHTHTHSCTVETLYTFHFHPGWIHNCTIHHRQLWQRYVGVAFVVVQLLAEVLLQLSLDDFHHISLNNNAEVCC